MGATAPFIDQDSFRWKLDTVGLNVDSGWAEVINVQLGNDTTIVFDANFRLRFLLQNTGDKNESDGYDLQYQVDSGGWVSVTGATSFVRAFTTSQYTDGDSATQILGGGTHDEGYGDTDGTITSFTFALGEESENEFCIQFRGVDFSGGEVLELRVSFDNGADLDNYTNTISMTMPTPPVGEIQQSHFRIRTIGALQTLNANGGGDWEAAIDTDATLDALAKYAGCLFGLRFELEEVATVSTLKTIIPKLQYRVNAGTWTDLNDANADGSADNYIAPGISDQIDNVIVVNKTTITDGGATTNIISGSSKTFVAGTGEHDVVGASVSLNDQHTEIEWRVLIRNRYNTRQESVDTDEYEFRIVESDNTLLDGTYVIPKITLNLPSGYIGGTGIETSANRSFIQIPDGTLYTIIEDGEQGNNVVMLKSIDDGGTWLQQDTGIAVGNDLEAFDMEYDDVNKIIHCVHVNGGVSYYQYATKDHGSPDTWLNIGGGSVYEHELEASVASINQSAGIVIRGTTLYAFFADLSGTDQVFYIKKSDLSTTDNWGSRVSIDTTGGSTDFSGVVAVLGPNSDLIHIFYTDYSLFNVHHISLSGADALGTKHTCETDLIQSSGDAEHGMTNAISWYNGSVEKAMIGYVDETGGDLFTCIVEEDGTPDTPLNASNSVDALSDPVGVNSRQPTATLAHDPFDDTIYLFYAEDATEDLWRATSADGAAWTGHTEEVGDTNWHALRAQVITEGGGDTVVGYIYDEPYNQDATQRSGFSGSNGYKTFFIRTGGDESIFVSDLGAGTDATPTIAASVPVSDLGAGTDIISQILASLTVSDVGGGIDLQDVVDRLHVVSDVGGGSDIVSQILASLTVSDVGGGSDATPTIIASVPVSDLGAGTDTVSQILASLTVSDVGGGSDDIAVFILKLVADIGGGIDAISNISASIPVSDLGSGTETFAVSVSLTVSDVGGGSDEAAALILILISDVGGGTDETPTIIASVPVSDLGAGTDTIAGISADLTVSDVGGGSDDVTALILIIISDVGGGTDETPVIAATIPVSDVGSGVDTVSQILASLTVSDVGGGIDLADVPLKELFKVVSDIGGGTDAVSNISVSLNVPDLGGGTETPSIAVSLTVSDLGSGVESVDVLAALFKIVSDVGGGIDSIGNIQVSVPVADSGIGTDNIGEVSVALSVSDSGSAIDTIGAILAAVSVADLGSGTDVIFKYDVWKEIVEITFTFRERETVFELDSRDVEFLFSERQIEFELN